MVHWHIGVICCGLGMAKPLPILIIFLGGSVLPSPENPYPISDQNIRCSIPYFRPDSHVTSRPAHPTNTKKGMLRLLRTNSVKVSFDKHMPDFQTRLLNRGYPNNLVTNILTTINFWVPNSTLAKTKTEKWNPCSSRLTIRLPWISKRSWWSIGVLLKTNTNWLASTELRL